MYVEDEIFTHPCTHDKLISRPHGEKPIVNINRPKGEGLWEVDYGGGVAGNPLIQCLEKARPNILSGQQLIDHRWNL